MACIFCKIAHKEMESQMVYEDDRFAAFHDIHPKAPLHLLFVPKKHIASIVDLQEEDRPLAGDLLWTAKQFAADNGVAGYKLLFNVGREGGQEIDHLHLHMLSNTALKKG